MARHSNAGRKTSTLHMLETDARLALIAELALARAAPAGPERSNRPPATPVSAAISALLPRTASYIVMDAPAEKEDVRPYLKVTRLLESSSVHVPHVHDSDVERGLLLLEDLGTTPYLARAAAPAPTPSRCTAMRWRRWRGSRCAGRRPRRSSRPTDARSWRARLALMPEWFLARHLALHPRGRRRRGCSRRRSSSSSPRRWRSRPVFVHRDYHSRNLMVLPRAQSRRHRFPGRAARSGRLRPGVAAEGLLHRLAARARGALGARLPRASCSAQAGLPGAATAQFLRWFDLIGVQRHVKVLGIFCRLWYRDGKSGYLADLPLTLDYVRDTCARYPELARFARFLEERVVPALPSANARGRGGRASGGAHEGHGAGGRARRADASAHRHAAQAAADASAASR